MPGMKLRGRPVFAFLLSFFVVFAFFFFENKDFFLSVLFLSSRRGARQSETPPLAAEQPII